MIIQEASSNPWPPPPDLESLKELFAAADPEGLIADDCPPDEYDPEAKHFFETTQGWPSSRYTSEHTHFPCSSKSLPINSMKNGRPAYRP
jgi:hypothetical protein